MSITTIKILQISRKSSYTPVPIQQPTYQRRHLHAPYAVDLTTNDNAPPAVAQTPASIPTVPIQVPLQATFLPSNIHNVQLVPCLCPIAEDYEYDPQTDTVVITQKPNNNKT